MPSILAGLVVFATTAAVLVMEILAGRLLAPYVGVSLETYTGIIGVVLAGISLGAWYGGRLADRVDPRRLLGPLIMAGGALALVTVPAVAMAGAAVPGGGPAAIVLLAAVGFFAPAAVLSAVPPSVVKLQLANLAETGRIVGWLSALGTAGAIVGVFVTGFLLVAAFPTRPVLLGLAVALIVGGGILWLWLSPRRDRAGAGLLALALVGGALTVAASSPCQFESAYFCGHIEADPTRPSGRLLWLDALRHSYVDLENPAHLEFSYSKLIADALAARWPDGEPVDAIHIGGGGFTLPRFIRHTRPGSTNQVLEIDPLLVEVAQSRLGLSTGDGLTVDVGDARLSLAGHASDSADLVVGDAFGGRAVPWHLTTREFLAEIHRVLRPGGVYAMNLIDSPPLGFARAEAATLQEVFAHVALLAPAQRVAGDEGGNFVLVASDEPLDAAAIESQIAERGGAEIVADGEALDAFIDGARSLTDDFAPVDQLLTPRR
ncbi:MAG TPA: fused MFS/spermidine synthase [Egibacteraceae bacterium]|nr:fused MFS/spermidine synthase [Egibacteraceae bacterium]